MSFGIDVGFRAVWSRPEIKLATFLAHDPLSMSAILLKLALRTWRLELRDAKQTIMTSIAYDAEARSVLVNTDQLVLCDLGPRVSYFRLLNYGGPLKGPKPWALNP